MFDQAWIRYQLQCFYLLKWLTHFYCSKSFRNFQIFNLEKRQYLPHYCSDNGFVSTIVDRTFLSLHGGSLNITLTVPLNGTHVLNLVLKWKWIKKQLKQWIVNWFKQSVISSFLSLEKTNFKLISVNIFYLLHNLDIGELLQHNYWIVKIRLNVSKELNLCHKLRFYHLYIFATQCRWPWIFQTMNSVRSNNLSWKYRWFTSLGYKDIKVINIWVCDKSSIPFPLVLMCFKDFFNILTTITFSSSINHHGWQTNRKKIGF